MTSEKAFILDGYVDEPACLGVSPYISPYVRYCAGACIENGFSVSYTTIDELRKNPSLLLDMEKADLFVFIAGITVPGKYLGGTPANSKDIFRIGTSLKNPVKCLGGPVLFGSSSGGGTPAEKESYSSVYDYILEGEISGALDSVLKGGKPHGVFSYPDIDRRSAAGSCVIKQHPAYPHVICELETARGCSRAACGGCSFCTEYLYGTPCYRSEKGVFGEVSALYNAGALHFRLGRQPDLLTYQASSGEEFPVPVPEKIDSLLRGIRDAAFGLKTLHIDNINPGTITRHPVESKEALESIVKWHTAGDTAAFGMESADPEVIRCNNLKAMPEDVLRAVRIVNDIGAKRDKNGVPHLLPGLNFVMGLCGETKNTYFLNESFLSSLLKSGLLVRRVNIRQVMPFEGTKAYTENTLGKFDESFKAFKETVRRDFDLPMLKKVFPQGTVLLDAVVEVSGDMSFARQLGSYPILIGVPYRLIKGSVGDFFVADWGYRSVTGFEKPFNVNKASFNTLKKLPGIGKKTAADIILKRPFNSLNEFEKVSGRHFYSDFITFD
ncbi:radical SAM superfamily enzyme with C-terminal helix-hairpin-helix motif [Methanomicrobium sp. W14]|uniref:helix-hairpin-helix domain-containing protein n=1 Tax=Methanomicrobium sp. W14 TaxID=2817839 RepID=UPI001AE667E6|nr:helix-hairpin-helix domain-containing protein [Methanomicrobium sp. W14]MBP2133047.1 radical SAM superfamily enzyme with C-terminal helix-hairpin-helix motif [Methanomicrobium sp. W14]